MDGILFILIYQGSGDFLGYKYGLVTWRDVYMYLLSLCIRVLNWINIQVNVCYMFYLI